MFNVHNVNNTEMISLLYHVIDLMNHTNIHYIDHAMRKLNPIQIKFVSILSKILHRLILYMKLHAWKTDI